MSIKGIAEEAPEGWVLENYEEPMPKGLGPILESVRRILKLGKVYELVIRLSEPIRYQRYVREAEADQKAQQEQEGEISPGEMARQLSMSELPSVRGAPAMVLVHALLALSARRLHLTHIGVAIGTDFFNWLAVDAMAYGGIEMLGGARFMRDDDIPDDVLLLFAGPRRGGALESCTAIFKVLMRSEQ